MISPHINKWYLLVLCTVIIGITVFTTYLRIKQNVQEPEIKQHKCITVHQFRIWTAKAEMFTDSIQLAPKSKQQRLIDSAYKYNQLLNGK